MRVNKLFLGFIIIFGTCVLPEYSMATCNNLPWEPIMDQILNSLTGPWLKFGCVASIVITGVSLAFGETGGILKRAMMIVLGLSVACASTSWALDFLGFGGGFSF